MGTEILYEFGEYMKSIKYNISKHRFLNYIEQFLNEKKLNNDWLSEIKNITVIDFINYFNNVASVRLLNILSRIDATYINDISPRKFYSLRNAGLKSYTEFEKLKRQLNDDIIKAKFVK
jgi:hypothetical protein